jgi:hypothetical protein
LIKLANVANREEQRAKAIEVMARAVAASKIGFPDKGKNIPDDFWMHCQGHATIALDALGDDFWVTGPLTDEMHRAAKELREKDKAKGKPTAWGDIFYAMAAAGDLTRP